MQRALSLTFEGHIKIAEQRTLIQQYMTGILVVDGWAVTLVKRGGDWAGPQPVQAPPRCTKCNSPPINGQCTNFILFDVALQLPLNPKG